MLTTIKRKTIEMLPIEEISHEIIILSQSLEDCKKKIHSQRTVLMQPTPKNLADFYKKDFQDKKKFCLQKIDQVLILIDHSIESAKITDFNIDRYKMEKNPSAKEGILNIINNDITDTIAAQIHIGDLMSDVNDLLSLIEIITDILSAS